MLRFTALFIVFFYFMAQPVFAADINNDGAKRLKTLFSKHIEKRKTAIKTRGGTIKTNGDIVVEQADDYYAVTLPSMTMTNTDGMTGEIGLIAINATPTDNPDNWKMSIAIPSPILYNDKEGNPTMRLDIGAQEMGGIWDGSLQNFSKLSATYSDVKLSHFQKQEILSIGKLNIAASLKEGEKDHWSGPTKITVENVGLAKPDGINFIELKKASLLIEFENFSPQKQLEALAKITNKTSADKEQVTDETLSGTIAKSIGDSFSFLAALNGLTINSPDIPAIEAKGLSLNNAIFSFSAHDLQGDKIQQSLKISYDGLKTKESKNKNNAFFPDKMNLNLNLNNLPLEDIINLAEKVLPSNKDNKSSKQVAALQAMFTLPKILSEAGTTLTLSKSDYGNGIYNVALNGTLKANPASIFGATGELIISIDQIDETLKKLKVKGNQQENIKKLNAIKEICSNKTASETEQTICHITLDESAKLSVNNQDMKLLLDVLSGESTPIANTIEDH